MPKQPSGRPDLPYAPFIWRDVRMLREIWPAYVPNWMIARSKEPAAREAGLDYVLLDVDLAGELPWYGKAEDIDWALGPEVRAWLANLSYLRKAGKVIQTPAGNIRGLPFAAILERLRRQT